MDDQDLTLMFKALGHPIRRDILDLLKSKPKTTSELTVHFKNVSRYAVMKHLNILEQANLLLVRREGRTRVNYINIVPLHQMLDRWSTRYQSNFASSIVSLKTKIEGSNNDMGLVHDSFQIEQEIMIEASREKVYEAMTKGINDWWSYRLCGEGSTLTFDPKVDGKFLEFNENGKAALWGTVIKINPPEEIRLSGLLGMEGAVNSAYSFKLEEKGSSTVLKLSHHAVGLMNPDWQKSHNEGWKELLGEFLKNYVEKKEKPKPQK
ncbi:SRPBCC domain-containing protein [Chengkuizengella sediminis]|uniref:SRPBCC domain-containing protein n=1 Tax=Chengkuizengella sediminis TaxID=1885917 RepID=UPI001389943F|nr:SRPBCC domain-containing protein [Chengkuizengella sediminis]NDI34299.1 helix-turn-helix domain-containing protein [Chengkuizengella sediminis]